MSFDTRKCEQKNVKLSQYFHVLKNICGQITQFEANKTSYFVEMKSPATEGLFDRNIEVWLFERKIILHEAVFLCYKVLNHKNQIRKCFCRLSQGKHV